MSATRYQRMVNYEAELPGGVDTLVFASGGGNAPRIRERIRDGLECPGRTLSGRANGANTALILAARGGVSRPWPPFRATS